MHTSTSATVYHMAGKFGGANFRGKSEKALRISFKFHDIAQSRGAALRKRWCN
jgi:hypothetical protein